MKIKSKIDSFISQFDISSINHIGVGVSYIIPVIAIQRIIAIKIPETSIAGFCKRLKQSLPIGSYMGENLFFRLENAIILVLSVSACVERYAR